MDKKTKRKTMPKWKNRFHIIVHISHLQWTIVDNEVPICNNHTYGFIVYRCYGCYLDFDSPTTNVLWNPIRFDRTARQTNLKCPRTDTWWYKSIISGWYAIIFLWSHRLFQFYCFFFLAPSSSSSFSCSATCTSLLSVHFHFHSQSFEIGTQ